MSNLEPEARQGRTQKQAPLTTIDDDGNAGDYVQEMAQRSYEYRLLMAQPLAWQAFAAPTDMQTGMIPIVLLIERQKQAADVLRFSGGLSANYLGG